MVAYPFMEQSYLLNVIYCKLIYDLAEMLWKNDYLFSDVEFLANVNALTLLILTLHSIQCTMALDQVLSALKTYHYN